MHLVRLSTHMNESENERLDFKTQHRKYNQEQQCIKDYIKEHSLLRPKTTVFTVLVMVLLYGIVCGSASLAVIHFIRGFEAWKIIFILLVWLIPLLCFSRYFLIKLVECYQHYAKESTRRKCLCKPTCSEYAIAVLKKYPLVIALPKIRRRLFKTCKGGFYKIDLP